MAIIHPVIRPPAEADSFLLQVTTGCSANSCTFCGAYLNKTFRLKESAEIMTDIEIQARFAPDTSRVFLMDGDALTVSNNKLVPILQKLAQSFPPLRRVASYANDYNILNRSGPELQELAGHKLKLIYVGLESGAQEILTRCRKRSTAQGMIEAVRKAADYGIHSSVIGLLGLGGKELSALHARETALALNAMQPRYLSFLSVMLIPGTELAKQAEQGRFAELTPLETLQELYTILTRLELTQTLFRANHASNFLLLEGRLPQDKARLLGTLEQALQGKEHIRPEFLRGL
jgi:radical SAM superfamily enzyme YgiQ (UPF0313 family)